MIATNGITKKQRSAFKKLCSIHGVKYVKQSMETGTEEQKEFLVNIALIQGMWYHPPGLRSWKKQKILDMPTLESVVCGVFDIPTDYYSRTRGQAQKHSYRLNRLSETFGDYEVTDTLHSSLIGQKLLFSLDLSSFSKLMEYNTRWFMSATSMDEAIAIFEMMVCTPLGLPKSDDNSSLKSMRDIKCHGLAQWFDYDKANMQLPERCEENFIKQDDVLKSKLKSLSESKNSLDMTFAILNQLRTFVDE
jgi:hypothetical protein